MLDLFPTPGEAVGPRPQSRARVRYNTILKWVRRAHLFAGLFMTPWVFLYGVSGFLFNHPEAFPDREVRSATRAEIAGTALAEFPTAPELADQVVKALNARAGAPEFELVDRNAALYSRTLFVTASGHGREHSVRFDPGTGASFIRSARVTKSVDAPWSEGLKLSLPDPPRERLARGVPVLLARLGIEADAVAVRNPPELSCVIAHDGTRWRVAYNLDTGKTTARPEDDPGSRLSTRRFLTGLHLAFTYPSRTDARWFWAVAVDAMCVSMVFWGVSGLLMWWQMKKLRPWGALTLILSATAAAVVAAGMHGFLASRG